MPYTFQGFGTKYYGQRDYALDTSYVTTEWVVFFFIPVVPVESLRVMDLGRTSSRVIYPVLSSSSSFEVYDVTKPNLKQVLCIYGFSVLMVVWFYSMCKMFGSVIVDAGSAAKIFAFLCGCLIPLPLPFILRSIAWRKVLRAEVERSNSESR